MIEVNMMNWKLPHPPKKYMKYKRMGLLEWIVSKIMYSHVCQICGRKEFGLVEGWLQIDCPIHKDNQGCSVICSVCESLNKEFFNPIKRIKKKDV